MYAGKAGQAIVCGRQEGQSKAKRQSSEPGLFLDWFLFPLDF